MVSTFNVKRPLRYHGTNHCFIPLTPRVKSFDFMDKTLKCDHSLESR